MGCRGGEDGPLAQLGPALEEVRLRVAERACELETSLELGDEALALQQQRDRVQGRDVWHAKHLKQQRPTRNKRARGEDHPAILGHGARIPSVPARS